MSKKIEEFSLQELKARKQSVSNRFYISVVIFVLAVTVSIVLLALGKVSILASISSIIITFFLVISTNLMRITVENEIQKRESSGKK